MNDVNKILVWVLQTGEPIHIDDDIPRPMRAMNLTNSLIEAGHSVVLWSSQFCHHTKKHRIVDSNPTKVSDNLEIRLIKSRGYNRNVGIGRLLDHAQMALNLKKMLKGVKRLPDVVFIGYPPIETAMIMADWCEQHDVPTLLDVKDQWPSIFLDASSGVFKPIMRVVLLPYFYMARKTMRNVTGLSAMAESFLEWALRMAERKRMHADRSIPLTTCNEEISEEQLIEARHWWDSRGIYNDGTMRFMFVGSHSQAFDFKPVQAAASLAVNESLAYEIIIAGDGDASSELREMMVGLSNVHFSGWIDRPKLIALAERCIGALAPYKNTEDFQMSLPNKVIDALSLGLPLLSPLKGEVASLITDYDVGLRYDTDTGKTLHECMISISNDKILRSRLSSNAYETYVRYFSYQKIYGGLVTHLEKMAEKNEALE